MPGAGRHTVDGPVGAALLVADGDAEPAVVGPHEADARPRLTVNVQHAPLTTIARPSFSPCNNTGFLKKIKQTGTQEKSKMEEKKAQTGRQERNTVRWNKIKQIDRH